MAPPAIMQVFKAFIQRRDKLSDIEFLAIKEFDGKLVYDEGVATSTADIASLTANANKDLYLARSKVSVIVTDTNSDASCTIELSANATTLETYKFKYDIATAAGFVTVQDDYEFKNIGHKVDATQVIKISAAAATNITMEGFVEGFEEADGDTPQI